MNLSPTEKTKKIVDNKISVDFNANSVLNVKECEIENLTLRENA